MSGHRIQLTQTLTHLASAFAVAYFLAGFLHGLSAAAAIALHGHNPGQVWADAGLYLGFIGAEGIEAPLNGGFLRDPGNDGAVTYINLYPFILPVFLGVFCVLERPWRWVAGSRAEVR